MERTKREAEIKRRAIEDADVAAEQKFQKERDTKRLQDERELQQRIVSHRGEGISHLIHVTIAM